MKRIRAYGIIPGEMEPGPLNKITDVAGVTVGHATVNTAEHKTGVTVILPCEDNPYKNKLTAAAYIHNGFGKSQGLVQIEELGTLETFIALTNTLNVGKVHDAVVDMMSEQCEREGIQVTTINPVVGECNDSGLNLIKERIIGLEEVRTAVREAKRDFEEGAVGAGTGTVCFGLKGGIGSASRQFPLGGKMYTVGALVQSNFGSTKNLMICGEMVGRELEKKTKPALLDRGSIMTVIATDLPLSDRQLKRVIKRAGVGLSRTGSFMGHGSGDIMIGFTTANRISEERDPDHPDLKRKPPGHGLYGRGGSCGRSSIKFAGHGVDNSRLSGGDTILPDGLMAVRAQHRGSGGSRSGSGRSGGRFDKLIEINVVVLVRDMDIDAA